MPFHIFMTGKSLKDLQKNASRIQLCGYNVYTIYYIGMYIKQKKGTLMWEMQAPNPG